MSIAALSDSRTKAAKAAVVAFIKGKGNHRRLSAADLLDADKNPDLRDDLVDLIADVLILAEGELGLDAAYIARVGLSHTGADAVVDDAAAHGIDPDDYTIDGLEFEATEPDDEPLYDGDGQYPPFRIFVVSAQTYLPGLYASRNAAEADRLDFLVGRPRTRMLPDGAVARDKGYGIMESRWEAHGLQGTSYIAQDPDGARSPDDYGTLDAAWAACVMHHLSGAWPDANSDGLRLWMTGR